MPLFAKITLRELRGGAAGFYIMLACLAVSTFALTASNSFTLSLTKGLQREGRTILGGDIEIRRVHLPFSREEKEFFTQNSEQMSQVARLRVMTRVDRRPDNALAELKSVDDHWPLIGAPVLRPKMTMKDALKKALNAQTSREGNVIYGAVASSGLQQALNIKVGDQFRIGAARFRLSALLETEPDGLADGISFAPRVIISHAALAATKLVQPGSLITYQTRLLLPEAAGRADQLEQRLGEIFPQAGWQVRSHKDSSPSVRRFVERVAMFLTLSSLTIFLVSGIGIANAVNDWLSNKRQIIAMMKSLGAPTGLITRVYLTHILVMALLGIMIGVVLGVAVPFAVVFLAGDVLPLPVQAELSWQPVVIAVVYGLLTSILFSLVPLAFARAVPAAHLFRAHIAPASLRDMFARMNISWIAAIIILSAGLFLLALFLSPERIFALYFLSGAAGALLLLYLIGLALVSFLRLLPPQKNPVWRIAIANITRPGAQGRNIIMAFGLGLALLSAVALIDSNLRYQIKSELPERAPSFFMADIRSDQIDQLRSFLNGREDVANIKTVPMLRGQIMRVNGVAARSVRAVSSAAWVLRGDRGLTYAAVPPQGSVLTQGQWWNKDYRGPPLLSISEDIAEGLGLGLGDTLSVNVLGRPLKAAIANIRKINWAEGGINFVLIFSPRPMQSAPHGFLMTINVPKESAKQLRREIAETFPNIVIIEVREVIDAITGLMTDIAAAARAASAFTLLAGLLVLAAAMAASWRQRLTEAVIFKVLGASRNFIARAGAMEYFLLGATAALAAMAIGGVGAWAVITFLWRAEWVFLPAVFITTTAIAILVAVGLGLAVNHRLLAQKPAPWLRQMAGP